MFSTKLCSAAAIKHATEQCVGDKACNFKNLEMLV